MFNQLNANRMEDNKVSKIMYKFLGANKFQVATCLYDVFSHDSEACWNYIQVGRQFWVWNDSVEKFELLTITYKRSGVAFYVKDNSEKEYFILEGSYNGTHIRPRIIYIKDVADFLNEKTGKDCTEDVRLMYQSMEPDIPDGVQIDIVE